MEMKGSVAGRRDVLNIGGEGSALIVAGGSDPVVRIWDPCKPWYGSVCGWPWVSADRDGEIKHQQATYEGDSKGEEESEVGDLGKESFYGTRTPVRKTEKQHEEGKVAAEENVEAFEKGETQIKGAVARDMEGTVSLDAMLTTGHAVKIKRLYGAGYDHN
ncbi:hypothetical protein JHK87_043316 [Glycine soja]|nr:hypothetical protein JHK87_043316 [Glycine soja]